jgi:hypothetical protein
MNRRCVHMKTLKINYVNLKVKNENRKHKQKEMEEREQMNTNADYTVKKAISKITGIFLQSLGSKMSRKMWKYPAIKWFQFL